MDIKLIVASAIIILMNVISFSMMAIDKKKSIKQHSTKPSTRRIPEKDLFIAALLFGGLGGCLGMIVMRHKTKHWYFALFFPLILIAQIALLILCYMHFYG